MITSLTMAKELQNFNTYITFLETQEVIEEMKSRISSDEYVTLSNMMLAMYKLMETQFGTEKMNQYRSMNNLTEKICPSRNLKYKLRSR